MATTGKWLSAGGSEINHGLSLTIEDAEREPQLGVDCEGNELYAVWWRV
jgi:hypothetical protein